MEKKKGISIFWVIFIVLISAVLIFFIVQACVEKPADMNDITGNWTEQLTQNTYSFIPSINIKGLVLRFEIYNSKNELKNTIDKEIGDVKKGQQYSVTLTLGEYMTGTQVRTIVQKGTRSLF